MSAEEVSFDGIIASGRGKSARTFAPPSLLLRLWLVNSETRTTPLGINSSIQLLDWSSSRKDEPHGSAAIHLSLASPFSTKKSSV
ncbi:hypothetical protein KM043_010342 [Ampulex compressa]|nr:hypothetical protein KM043_010342 [Ampulex compressa]